MLEATTLHYHGIFSVFSPYTGDELLSGVEELIHGVHRELG